MRAVAGSAKKRVARLLAWLGPRIGGTNFTAREPGRNKPFPSPLLSPLKRGQRSSAFAQSLRSFLSPRVASSPLPTRPP